MDETENVLQEYQKYGQAKAVRQVRLKSLQNLRVSSSGGIFVLVIGESENRDHMQAYGYDRPDTPWLSQQAGKADTILFTHAYSNHSLTVPVLTYALSEKNQYNDIPLEDACSLMEVAKAAGYDTFWLSNQRQLIISCGLMSGTGRRIAGRTILMISWPIRFRIWRNLPML